MPRTRLISAILTAGFAIFAMSASLAAAHGSEKHEQSAVPVKSMTAATGESVAANPFPVDIGAPFELTDHRGNRRSLSDFEGQYPIIFFGYARCESICPVALRHMLEAVDLLGDDGSGLRPILITVDPDNETPDVLAEEVPKLHPRLVGLTGSASEITAVRKSFGVESELVGTSIKGDPVFAHGSFLYLMGKDGEFLTLFPPILDGATMAEKIRPYLL